MRWGWGHCPPPPPKKKKKPNNKIANVSNSGKIQAYLGKMQANSGRQKFGRDLFFPHLSKKKSGVTFRISIISCKLPQYWDTRIYNFRCASERRLHRRWFKIQAKKMKKMYVPPPKLTSPIYLWLQAIHF